MAVMWKQILTVLIFFTIIAHSSSWRRDRRPRQYGDQILTKNISPKTRKVQDRIVMIHDYFRSKVRPKAANMLSMSWHNGAARSAQIWADQCLLLQHDTDEGRWVHNYGSCGQNIFVSSHKVPWHFVMQTWFRERWNFTYASPKNELFVVGHYTQMVNAATHKVGCGLTRCRSGGFGGKPFYNYVCNYCPIGNHPDRLGQPYVRGRPCSMCPYDCKSKKIRLCTNACHAADQWSNCKDLYRRFPGWLCNESTNEGLDRRDKCKATCTCKNKIHEFM